MSVRTAACCLMLAFATCAEADELVDKACPILEKSAAELGDKAAEIVQVELVFGIGDAWAYNGEALRTVTDNIDASAAAGFPEARDALLKRLEMQSLQQALR